ncbi:MAG: lantibiotic dehydratase, partial [Bacteroidota bacterium]
LGEAEKSDNWGVPASMYVLGTLLAENSQRLDNGDFQFLLKAFGGPSAGSLLARFCHGNEALSQKVKECLEHEQLNSQDTILAEVVHLPESRIGNILMRPTFREYEIPYLGNASVEKDKQIPIDDLMVSVQFGKIRLRSKRLNKFVIPRLTSAHNYARGLSIYKFLCELQFQNINMNVYWNWGILNDKPYLPRVEFENVILCPAQWTIPKREDFKKIVDNIRIEKSIAELQNKVQLPNQCLMVEGDNELLIDLSTYVGRKILFEKLAQTNVILHEFLSSSDRCFIGDEGSRFCNEVIIPMAKVIPEKAKVNRPIFTEKAQITRSFSIGSEWLYVKLYGGVKSLDKILGEVIHPLVNELLSKNIIEKWFFIRYEDPDKHLRLRFSHSQRVDFWSIVLAKLNEALKPYLDEGIIYKIQTDTYQREIERYGLNTMALSELVFLHDSEAVAGFLSLIEGDAGEKYRWLFGLRGLDMLLDDFGYDLPQKAQLMNQIKNGFFNEFGGGDKLRHQLNDKYRLERNAIESILDSSQDTDEFSPAIDFLNKRSEKLQEINRQLRQNQSDDDQTKSHDYLMQSYIHMMMNRLFLTNNRAHELVIYYFLDRYYESCLARQKRKKNKTEIIIEELLLLN